MSLVLETTPAFLRQNFPQIRMGLLGENNAWSRSMSMNFGRSDKKSYHETIFLKLIRGLLSIIFVVSLTIAGVLVIPDFYYWVFPVDVSPIESIDKGTPLGGDFSQGTKDRATAVQKEEVLPPQDENLPTGDWLIIPRIGIRTELGATKDPAEALQEGVWLAPDYGRPGDEYDLPIILAAHRFGWDWWWQTDYWKYNSFYYLPEVEQGDMIEIIADQRKWVYEVYAGEEGEEITDYDADLILYTCKFLNSPLRHFRYARLISLDQNTQG
ncbi:hypothetical protein KJ707_03940 [Patescibacteria group bacterium]|nr:hypothetical protein [Patescibacteria group bacterium]MBU1966847.1 hypothetical protein [Patescibacteria group bacterium]MBU2543682.1 hypothetical protein [Patescibacteria group bacterium]